MWATAGLDESVTGESSNNASWEAAWVRASALLKGVTRRRVRGSSRGVELALLDWGGEGDLVLLHHANGFCGATLAPIASALRDRFRVVSVDARGHGDSTPVPADQDPDAYAWPTLAADLEAALPQILALVDRPSVRLAIGHSFGGALVLAAAEREPTLFEKILLCDPVIFPPMTAEENSARAQDSGLVAATLKRRDRFPSREAAFEHFRSRGLFARFTPEALALYVGEGTRPAEGGGVELKCARTAEAAIFAGGALIDLFSEADRVTAEVLFVHARGGNFSRDRYAELARRMNDARVESLPC